MTEIDELARRVADAAMAIEIAHNAIVRVNQLDPNRIVTPISDQDAIWKLIDAERAALGALMNAVREYRARVEAAAFMARPAVRRGLEGCGEMEEGESLIKETSEE